MQTYIVNVKMPEADSQTATNKYVDDHAGGTSGKHIHKHIIYIYIYKMCVCVCVGVFSFKYLDYSKAIISSKSTIVWGDMDRVLVSCHFNLLAMHIQYTWPNQTQT